MAKKVILCVDDEEMILNSLEMQLHEHFGDDYVYDFAENADDALEIIAELYNEGLSILVIVSDWLMPGMKGDEFLIKVHENFPEIVKVLLTGQADQSAIENARDMADLHECIFKPWKAEDLVQVIKSGLEKLT